MTRKIKLINTIKFLFFAAIILLTVIIVILQITRSQNQFTERSELVRNDYVAAQKTMIKREVMQVVATIKSQRAQSKLQTRQLTKQRSCQAYAVAQNLYNKFHLYKPEAEVKQLIVETLRSLRFKQDGGYFFITSLDGTEVLFADKPELEGMNLLNMQDTTGKFVVKDMIDIAENSGEGSYEYHWSKPDVAGNNYLKVSYVKHFQPYGWVIGTGLYVADIEKKMQKKLLTEISQIRFGEQGYIFINRFNADVLVVKGKLFDGTKKLWQIFNGNPQKTKAVFAKVYKAAQSTNGDYIYYTFQKLKGSGKLIDAPKTSFIYGIKDLQWLVGTGVYLDDVEEQIAALQIQQTRQLHDDIKTTVLASLLLLIVFLALFHILSRWIISDFAHFVKSVDKAASGDLEIDCQAIHFSELVKMGDDVNIMLHNKVSAQRDLLEEKENLRITLNSIGDAVIATDIEGRITSMNPVAAQLTGWDIKDALGAELADIFNIVNAVTKQKAINPVCQVLENGKIIELANHTLLIAKGGARYHIADSAAPIHDIYGTIAGVVLVFRDVSEDYYMREKLNRSEKRYRNFFENSSDAMLIIRDGLFIDCNNTAATLLGYSSTEELKLKKPDELSPEFQPGGQKSADKVFEMIELALKKGSHRFEWEHLTKIGDPIPVEVSLTAMTTDDGNIVLHTVWRDLSVRNLAIAQLEHLAHHHPLTGLPNRLLLNARLEHSIQYAQRENIKGALLFLDLDDFKKINDSLGHSCGDEVLQIAATRLQQTERAVDTVAHISGDEFVIVLQSIRNINDAVTLAQKILLSMRQPFVVNDYELFISCSIGIVEFDGNCDGMENLLKHADAAMYQAKANGKNSYQIYSAQLTESLMAKVVLEAQLRRALEHHELVVFYQPQVSLPQGNIVAVEALMRWQHPELGLIPPNQFIPLSEETGLIVPMGEWIMRCACEQLVEWRAQGYNIHRVAVNLSGKQLQLETLPQIVQKVLQQTGCPAYALELEITEGFIMRHPEQTIAMLQQIRELGVEMSVDDFGTGHSSLNYLKRLPINRLKIDCSFVWDIGKSTNGEALVKSIINLGHNLNLQITAEGIENEEQKLFLENLHCNEGQGYLFSKPQTAEEITKLLQKKQSNNRG